MNTIHSRIKVFIPLAMFIIIYSTSANEAQGQVEKVKAPQKVDLLILGGGTGSTWEAISNGMSEIIRKNIPGYSANTTLGSGVSNISRVAKGGAELGLSELTSVLYAQRGINPFEQKISNIRTVLALYDNTLQFMVRAKIGIDSIQDIKNKKYPLKVSVFIRGSTVEQLNKRFFEAHGITYEDIKSWGGGIYFTDSTESDNLFRDGHIDAISFFSIVPVTYMFELAKSMDVKFLRASEEAIQKLKKEYDYKKGIIPVNTYKSQNTPIDTLATIAVLIAREEVPEEVIYKVTKVIVENINFLGSTQRALKDLPIKYMAGDGLERTMHRGAQKYFREIGALK
jgi:TRAP transporter TAXI family solute receptor